MLFDAVCGKCGHVFEYVSSSADKHNPPKCPSCGSSETRYTITKVATIGCSMSLGLRKPDSDFRDMLSIISKKNPGSNVNDRK